MGTSGIQERAVVITSASSGLGESTAMLLARHGAKVLGARRKDRVRRRRHEARRSGGAHQRSCREIRPRRRLGEQCGCYAHPAHKPSQIFAPGGTVYCSTKSAVRALTEGLRMELHSENIRCTIISPGAVQSELENL